MSHWVMDRVVNDLAVEPLPHNYLICPDTKHQNGVTLVVNFDRRKIYELNEFFTSKERRIKNRMVVTFREIVLNH